MNNGHDPQLSPVAGAAAQAVVPKLAAEPPAADQPQEFRATLVLNVGAVNLILEGLGELPAKRSSQAIAAIGAEVERQFKAWQAEQQQSTHEAKEQ